jgi:hypothetical protein
MSWLWRFLVPIKPFGLFFEGMAWYGGGVDFLHRRVIPMRLERVSDPTQVGLNRSDPEHYDEMGRYKWWGC